MSERTVKTQAELDQALADRVEHFVACEVSVEDISPIHEGIGSTAKCKVRACRVLHEVDINGRVVYRKEADK